VPGWHTRAAVGALEPRSDVIQLVTGDGEHRGYIGWDSVWAAACTWAAACGLTGRAIACCPTAQAQGAAQTLAARRVTLACAVLAWCRRHHRRRLRPHDPAGLAAQQLGCALLPSGLCPPEGRKQGKGGG